MRIITWGVYLFLLLVVPRILFYIFYILRLYIIGFIVAAGVFVLILWGAAFGRTNLIVNRVDIYSDSLPESFDGFTIAQFSDLHIGSLLNSDREIGEVVQLINDLHPDIIIFSGDLVNIRHNELDVKTMELLGSLTAPYGVVSAIGNHDVGHYIKDSVSLSKEHNLDSLITKQRAMGWQLIQDSTVYLLNSNDSISLSVLDFSPALQGSRHSSQFPEVDLTSVYRNIPNSSFNITVSHIPQLWDQITALGYGDLTLSGHVHSMQMKLSVAGHKFSPAQLMYDRWSGLYENNGKYLYINDGIGYVGFPMRLGADPEITLLTLRRQ